MLDDFGDRMKGYEAVEAQRRLDPGLPTIARLDGRSFSAFTRGLPRPFDARLSQLMVETMTWLVRETNAQVGYTQSDEITLVFPPAAEGQIALFGLRVQKLTSVLAALATACFVRGLDATIPERAGRLAVFDCRVWSVPDLSEAANAVLWRVQDGLKNSVSMAAHHRFGDTALHGRTGEEKKAMLAAAGIDWDAFPGFFKHGTLVRRIQVQVPFTAEEIAALPPLHNAHRNPALRVERTVLDPLEGPLGLVRNRIGYLFGGEAPDRG